MKQVVRKLRGRLLCYKDRHKSYLPLSLSTWTVDWLGRIGGSPAQLYFFY